MDRQPELNVLDPHRFPLADKALAVEQAVLGSVLYAAADIASGRSFGPHPLERPHVLSLPEEAFTDPRHQAIWRAIHDLHAEGGSVDLVRVTDRLRAQGHLRGELTAVYVTSLDDAYVVADNIDWHIAQLRHLAARRAFVQIASLCREAQQPDAPLQELAALIIAMGTAIVEQLPDRALTFHRIYRQHTPGQPPAQRRSTHAPARDPQGGRGDPRRVSR